MGGSIPNTSLSEVREAPASSASKQEQHLLWAESVRRDFWSTFLQTANQKTDPRISQAFRPLCSTASVNAPPTRPPGHTNGPAHKTTKLQLWTRPQDCYVIPMPRPNTAGLHTCPAQYMKLLQFERHYHSIWATT